MKKFIGLLAAMATVAMMALPAAAAQTVPQDAGVFSGQASVGSSRDGCTNAGVTNLGTGGLALLDPAPAGPTFYYGINAPASVISLARNGARGTLNLCGTLNDNATELGASCATTTGTDGKGLATWGGGDDVYIDELGWPITAGGTFVVTGEVAQTASKAKADPAQKLVAVVQALDNGILQDCVANNASLFNVVAAYAVA